MRPALVEGLNGSIDYVAWGLEIGFANLQMDDITPLRFKRFGADENLESGFSADSRHGGGKLHVYRTFQYAAG
jgi:hypothetical protein